MKDDKKYASLSEMGYPDEDLSLLKNTFGSEPRLLNILFNHFIQAELTPDEKSLLEQTVIGRNDVVNVIRKYMCPTLYNDVPFYQKIDLWTTVNFQQIGSDVYSDIKATNITLKYLNQQLALLEDTNIFPTINFDDLTDLTANEDDVVSNVRARAKILRGLNIGLNTMRNLAGQKDDTVEETKKKILANSTK